MNLQTAAEVGRAINNAFVSLLCVKCCLLCVECCLLCVECCLLCVECCLLCVECCLLCVKCCLLCVKCCLLPGNKNTVTRRITTFRSTTDRIYDGGPIRLYHIIIKLGAQGLPTGWTVRGSNPGKDEIIHNFPDRPGALPGSYTMGTESFLGVKRPGRGFDHIPHLAPRLKKE